MPESMYALALLACPVGMGLMMWVMMRGGRVRQPQGDAVTATNQAELFRLEAEVDQLQAERDKERAGA